MATVSRKMAGLLPASESAGRGRFLPASEAHYELAAGRSVECLHPGHGAVGFSDWPVAGTSLGRGRHAEGIFVSGQADRLRHAARCGRTPSTSSCFAPLPMAQVYDAIPEVRQRYLGESRQEIASCGSLETGPSVRFMRQGSILRIHGTEPFRLRWSSDGWKSQPDTESSANALRSTL